MSGDHLSIVVARARNGAIGKDGGLPWHLPADLRHFKAATLGAPMIMGRRTFESLPGLLPGRRHVVLTRDRGWRAEGAEVAHDPPAALALAGRPAAIIGGAEAIALLEPFATRYLLTEIHADAEGDTRLPYPDPARWRETAREEHPAEGGRPAYGFVTLLRR